MRTKKLLIFLFLTSIPYAVHAISQDNHRHDETLYEITTRDGTRTMGTLISENDTSVTIDVTNVGVITILRDNIVSITELDATVIKEGRYWFPNPNATRHLFSPNALAVGKGSGYYQNTWIFFNNFNYGITERLSLGAGFVPIFLLGVHSLPIWILPKYSIPVGSDKLHISAGAMLGGVIGEGSSGVGLAYSNMTYGNRNNNITAGIGFGYQGDGFSKTPAINISGMTRFSQKFYVISENYFFAIDDGIEILGSLGIRYAPETFAIDFAIVRPFGTGDGFIGIPWLGVTIPFKRGNQK